MQMIRVETRRLTGLALAWAVAVAKGGVPVVRERANGRGLAVYESAYLAEKGSAFSPGTNPSNVHPLIDAYRISVIPDSHPDLWLAAIAGEHLASGRNPLIAAARCFVLSCLGAEVDVPTGLMGRGAGYTLNIRRDE